jgi:anthranilate/para-aminobenzoate synthase component I
VADSDPEKEWFETDHKSAALMKALALAGEEV